MTRGNGSYLVPKFNFDAPILADGGESHKREANSMDEEDLLWEDRQSDDTPLWWPSLEEQLNDVGMSIHDFI